VCITVIAVGGIACHRRLVCSKTKAVGSAALGAPQGKEYCSRSDKKTTAPIDFGAVECF